MKSTKLKHYEYLEYKFFGTKLFSRFTVRMFLVLAASKQLSKVAVQLVKESFGDLLYEKAMGCVKALREETVKVSLTTTQLS